MKIIIFLLILIVSFYAIWFIYLFKWKKASIIEALEVLESYTIKFVRFLLQQWNQSHLREQSFSIDFSFSPFIEQVKALSVSKYFKYVRRIDTIADICEVHFSIIGITNEYKENLSDLSVLLTRLLQDHYIDIGGVVRFPLVCQVTLKEGEAVWWISKNALGNQKIQERAYADQFKDIPNSEELIDE